MKMKERPKNRLAGWIGSDNEQKVENQIGMGKQKLQYIKIPNEVRGQIDIKGRMQENIFVHSLFLLGM